MDRKDTIESRRRRRMLAQLGLAAGTAYMAPVLMALSGARASDSVSSFSAPSGPTRPSFSAPSRPVVRQPAPRAAAPPELAVAVGDPADFAALEGAGYRLLSSRRIDLTGYWLGRFGLPDGMTPEAARAQALRLVPGAKVESNDLYRASEMLCRGEGCDAFELIGWPQPEPCAAAPRIGMIDSGINPGHDAFAGQTLEIVDFDLGSRAPAGATHGTAVAALLIGRAESRTPGLLPNATLIAVEAFHSDGQDEAADVYALLGALDALAARGVGVVNMSFAGPENALLSEALDAAAARGIAMVAAAGNAGPRTDPLYPAAHEAVVAVTAVDSAERVYRQANAGPHIGFAAPGVQIWTAASVSGGRLRSGTSYAAPFVTAALAVAREARPGLMPQDHVEMLAARARDLGDAGFDPTFGWGLVQAGDLCLVPV